MKSMALAALFTLAPFVRAAPEPAVDFDRLIRAIAEIEQGAWGKPGGICNISYAAWAGVSPLSYVASANESLAMPVYRAHLDHLAKQLVAAGVRVNAQTLGTCWRWGFAGARKRHWTSDQGQRTANLYADFASK